MVYYINLKFIVMKNLAINDLKNYDWLNLLLKKYKKNTSKKMKFSSKKCYIAHFENESILKNAFFC